MSWEFKNNFFLRTILVMFIGLIAFELLFNSFNGGTETMGGGENMGNMGNSMGMSGGTGYSLGGLVGGLLVLLVKILMIVLVVAVVIGVIVWIRNAFFQNTSSKFVQSIKDDPILKTISVVTVAIIGIVFIFAVLGSFNQTGMGFSGQMGSFNQSGMASGSQMGNFNLNSGYNPIYSIVGLLTILIKVLMFVFIISLILAAVVYLKKQYDRGNLKFFSENKNQDANMGVSNINNEQTASNTNVVNLP